MPPGPAWGSYSAGSCDPWSRERRTSPKSSQGPAAMVAVEVVLRVVPVEEVTVVFTV